VSKTAGPAEQEAWDWLVERVRARYAGERNEWCVAEAERATPVGPATAKSSPGWRFPPFLPFQWEKTRAGVSNGTLLARSFGYLKTYREGLSRC